MKAYENAFVFSHIEDSIEKGAVSFFYELYHNGEKTEFEEKLAFPAPDTASIANLPSDLRRTILSAVHVVLGLSYWKTRIPKELVIKGQPLTPFEAAFWNLVYTKGLGEFFYKNNIDFRGLVAFPSGRAAPTAPSSHKTGGKGALVLLGGGKDSLVTAELLKKNGIPFSFFALNPQGIHETIAKAAGVPLISFSRQLDAKLFELNKKSGVLNGHIPISAVYAATGILAAFLYGYDAVIASNEKSANYGNVSYLGSEINHQWSKSFEFEVAMRTQVKHTFQSALEYFSILRPIHEFRVVELFSAYPQYFPLFVSCNVNFKVEGSGPPVWCGRCAKCAFVFLLLSAFIAKEKLVAIFGHNLFEDAALESVFEELLGLRAMKPFDCVGTPKEAAAALFLAARSGFYANDSMFMRLLSKTQAVHKDADRLISEAREVSGEHAIPRPFESIVSEL
jgi:hypothetical protein